MSENLNLAIIEENSNHLGYLHDKLKDFVPEITCYSNAEEAMLKMTSNMPDVLVMDLDMPKLNGTRVCDLLRDDPRFKDLPIVLVSGRESIGDFNLYFKGIDFVKKPVVGTELFNKIRLYNNLHNAYIKVVGMYREGS